MKYCPQCEAEYLDHAEQCADCGCLLTDEASFRAGQAQSSGVDRSGGEEMAMVCPVADQVDADQVMGLLQREGIAAYLHSYAETVNIGYADLHQGFGEVWVPRYSLGRARCLVDELYCSPPSGFGNE